MISSACPPLVQYQPEFLVRAANDLMALPPDSPVRELIKDYKMVRDQIKACQN